MKFETPIVVAPDHPAFAGHFPGQPILPGVVLLDWATNALGVALGRPVPPCEITTAKFLQPVRPGTSLLIRHVREASGAWHFEILAGDATVASGTLRLAAP